MIVGSIKQGKGKVLAARVATFLGRVTRRRLTKKRHLNKCLEDVKEREKHHGQREQWSNSLKEKPFWKDQKSSRDC